MKIRIVVFTLLLAWVLPMAGLAQSAPLVRRPENLSLRNEVQLAIDRGLAFLKSKQKEDGSWPDPDNENPATTAFPVLAFQGEPRGKYTRPTQEFLGKAYDYLRKQAKPDGGLYQKELKNVNTALCLTALLGANEPKDAAILRAANDFLVGLQLKNMALSAMDGGFGYGPDPEDRQTADLHNTVCTLEALHAYKAATPNVEGRKDLNWQAAIDFVSHCQNLRSNNKEGWASDDAGNKGGFIYSPGYSTAGDMAVPGGRKVLRSYGSMSYAGLLCYAYGGLPKTDPRVTATVEWLAKNFTLDENPGLGSQGRFLYYHLMAKGLAAADMTELNLPNGKTIEWARELAVKLVASQKGNGTWLNDNGRWMENDEVLATSYIVIALEIIYQRL